MHATASQARPMILIFSILAGWPGSSVSIDNYSRAHRQQRRASSRFVRMILLRLSVLCTFVSATVQFCRTAATAAAALLLCIVFARSVSLLLACTLSASVPCVLWINCCASARGHAPRRRVSRAQDLAPIARAHQDSRELASRRKRRKKRNASIQYVFSFSDVSVVQQHIVGVDMQ